MTDCDCIWNSPRQVMRRTAVIVEVLRDSVPFRMSSAGMFNLSDSVHSHTFNGPKAKRVIGDGDALSTCASVREFRRLVQSWRRARQTLWRFTGVRGAVGRLIFAIGR